MTAKAGPDPSQIRVRSESDPEGRTRSESDPSRIRVRSESDPEGRARSESDPSQIRVQYYRIGAEAYDGVAEDGEGGTVLRDINAYFYNDINAYFYNEICILDSPILTASPRMQIEKHSIYEYRNV